MDTLPDLASLRLDGPVRLDTLPVGVLRSVFQHFNTAQSLARLAGTSKALKAIVEHHGWNVFVRTHFGYLDLPPGNWKTWAKSLTWQTRAWERRALLLSSLVSPKKLTSQSNRGGRGRGGRGGRSARPAQTFPPSVFVDASSHMKGKNEEELVAWGIGEDVVVRWRELRYSAPKKEKWTKVIGETSGLKAGQDDVSALALVKDAEIDKTLMMLVGRASGYLQLVSTHQKDMGRTIAWLQPESTKDDPSGGQHEIQHIDVKQFSAIVATKDSVLMYSLPDHWPDPDDLDLDEDGNPAKYIIQPAERLDLKAMEGPGFQQIRQARHLLNGDIAVALSGTTEPLRYLTRTPAGTVIINAAKMQTSSRCSDSYIYSDLKTQTSRCILPLDTSSLPGGSQNTVLSSNDDGTIRLQDMRTPSAIDTIYQDHFELISPIGPLLTDGEQRFIAGSARTSVVKVFDYRWTKSYCYTDAMPCSASPLGPAPKPLTWATPPRSNQRERCCYAAGKECARHLLAKTDFYRPNCNIYLPNIYQDTSPVYSLARASDMSPNIYAGLSGELVTMSLRDQVAAEKETAFMQKRNHKLLAGYAYHESLTSLVETGDGIALKDISESVRVPAVRKHGRDPAQIAAPEFSRLDEWLM